RHALRALALVAASHPRDAVAPLVPRILAAALRRVRDQDSSVRAALVDTARAAAAASASASASAALRPLTDALLHEQDQCAQRVAAERTLVGGSRVRDDMDEGGRLPTHPRRPQRRRSFPNPQPPATVSLFRSSGGC
uniref:TORTIFOLIA1/SINE1-2 N-terminal domain-containing protein n=1 Tax=Zea mays TaxID=4577 RepID=A0A804PLP3_MAIZE